MPEIAITAMTLGAFGVGRLDGKTVMVPNSVPGDVVRARVVEQHRDYSVARLEEVLRPGPDRRTPPCPYLPRCGGCDWQQIAYTAQLRMKAELVASELGRALKIDIDPRGLVEPAASEFGYRSRIRLRVGPGGKLGFYELGSNRLVEIERCLVAAEGLRLPHELAAALWRRCPEIEVVGDRGREVLVARMAKAPERADMARARTVLEADRSIAGMVLGGGGVREVLGEVTIGIELESGLVLEVDADLFSQVNHEQNRKLIAMVMNAGAIGEGMSVLDLFCGAGNFSLPAARRGAEVLGVDAEALAIAAAARNAERLGLKGARFVATKAAETAQFLRRARYRADVVVLDPPRGGARDLMELIAGLHPPVVVYVSCNASTLARDLKLLSSRGYRLKGLRALDFFPNTHHVEIVAQAVLT